MLLQLMCFALVLPALKSEVIQPLQDGIIVEKGNELRVEEGLWTILVTLEDAVSTYRPRELADLHDMVSALRRRIDDPNDRTDELVTEQKKQAWKHRLALLLRNNTMTFTRQPHRLKRGLIDLGGTLLNKIFGVATETEVNQVREAILAAGKRNEAIIHNSNQLITIVNTTRLEERETRRKLNDLIGKVKAMHADEYAKWSSFMGIAKALMIDEMVAMLESISTGLRREISQEAEIKNTLEGHHLTENIFPISLFNEISSLAERFLIKNVRITWYYEHLTVVPLLIEDSIFVYRIQLPFVPQDEYLRYRIRTWPVPFNHSLITIQLSVGEDIAVHTTAGYIFKPESCVGFNPQICQTGPLYQQSSFECERGIMTAHQDDRSKCHIKQGVLTHTQLYTLSRGHYVIVSKGETYTLSCRRQRQIKSRLAIGTYEINLPGGCTLSGEDWTLKGETLQFINVSVQVNRVNITPFNLEENPEFAKKSTPFDINTLDDVPRVDIKKIEENDFSNNYNLGEVGHHMSWVAIIAIVIVVIILILAIRWVCKHRALLKFYFTRTKPTKKPDQLLPMVNIETTEEDKTKA
jgi:hypothetical protein